MWNGRFLFHEIFAHPPQECIIIMFNALTDNNMVRTEFCCQKYRSGQPVLTNGKCPKFRMVTKFSCICQRQIHTYSVYWVRKLDLFYLPIDKKELSNSLPFTHIHRRYFLCVRKRYVSFLAAIWQWKHLEARLASRQWTDTSTGLIR